MQQKITVYNLIKFRVSWKHIAAYSEEILQLKLPEQIF